ncbi:MULTISPECIES: DUF485 domain-containing protein [unclassified Pseudomonas]|uniref:DUF485 domain-containing protein n=1 Tax=unclassified Pseudomonas TaxID=196821 RepID=UPI00159FCD6B|nr:MULTISPECIES: DUF485 domain-containing protein [unclassified Pseudomonas]NWC93825.1 DUF485 domain-containing protein [Pseudomonas sp. IPO3779]NWD16201.1 DUF485 domain-containing protein [Pseudomonas sp. IPO3778]
MSTPFIVPKSDTSLARLKKIRLRLILGLTVLTLGTYFGFILLVAFVPHWLTLPLSTESRLTTGIVAGIGLYWFCVAVTGFYTWYANRRIDPLLREMQYSADTQDSLPQTGQPSDAGATTSSLA